MANDFELGGWVAEANACYGMGFAPRLAKIRDIYPDGHLDLVLYSYTGERIGRESPALGGPTHFEPYCCPDNWEPIDKPQFAKLLEHRSSYGYLLNWHRPHPEYAAEEA